MSHRELQRVLPGMPDSHGDPLPEQIVLTRSEAAIVLFALDEAMESVATSSSLYGRLEAAARIIVERFLPDLRDL